MPSKFTLIEYISPISSFNLINIQTDYLKISGVETEFNHFLLPYSREVGQSGLDLERLLVDSTQSYRIPVDKYACSVYLDAAYDSTHLDESHPVSVTFKC